MLEFLLMSAVVGIWVTRQIYKFYGVQDRFDKAVQNFDNAIKEILEHCEQDR